MRFLLAPTRWFNFKVGAPSKGLFFAEYHLAFTSMIKLYKCCNLLDVNYISKSKIFFRELEKYFNLKMLQIHENWN